MSGDHNKYLSNKYLESKHDQETKADEPVGHNQLFQAIAAAVTIPYAEAIGISVTSFTKKLGNVYLAPPDTEALRQRVKELEERESTLNEALKLARQGAEFCFNQAKDADANAAVQNAAVHELVKQLATKVEQIKQQEDDIAALTEALRHDRVALQADAAHPAPCQKFCEATAFRIDERRYKRTIAEQAEQIKVARELLQTAKFHAANTITPKYVTKFIDEAFAKLGEQ